MRDEKERNLNTKGEYRNASNREYEQQYKNLDSLDSLDKIQLKDNDYKYRENPENSYDRQQYCIKNTNLKASRTLGVSKNIDLTLPPVNISKK